MSLDVSLLYLLNSLAGQSPALDVLIIFFASYLAYVVILLFLIFLLVLPYARKEKVEIFIVALLGSFIARFGVTEALRHFIHRPRPYLTLSVHNLFTDTAWSFPSGHATFFFALAMAVYLYHKRWGTAFFALAALISLGRVAAGVHYPSDIIAGAIIAICTGYFVYFVAERVYPKWPVQTT